MGAAKLYTMASTPQKTSPVFGSALSMWLVWAVDLVWPGDIGHGIVPRTSYGLSGILMAPFLHANLQHLLANTIPFLILGVIIAMRGARAFVFVTFVSAAIAGAGTWLFGMPNTQHIGASGVVFGFFGYLLFRALFDGRVASTLIAIVIAILYGASILYSLVPAQGVSWTGHIFGFAGGIAAARLRYDRGR
jgi:membrane associated rhomboid family serine protease